MAREIPMIPLKWVNGHFSRELHNIPVVIVDATNPTTVLITLVEGTYVFRMESREQEGISCPWLNLDDVTITVVAPATAGPDQTHCNVTNVQLVGTSKFYRNLDWYRKAQSKPPYRTHNYRQLCSKCNCSSWKEL